MEINLYSLVSALQAAKKRNALILLAGNGGSMVNALHIELHLQEIGFRAISLSNPAILTARANDFGVERMFANSVEALGLPNDMLLAISGSGSSPNILAAVAVANKKGLLSAGISFTKNSPLLKAVALPVLFASPNMGAFEDDCSVLSHELKRYL